MDRQFTTDPGSLAGASLSADPRQFSDQIAWHDHKIAFVIDHAEGKDVLDLGCVEHDPENYRGRFWVHRALREKAASVTGVDLSESGTSYLRERGFDIVHADVQNFDLGRKFDIVVAGDLMEHLEDFSGFLKSVKRHLREDGALLVSTPNPWFWKHVVRSILSVEVPNNPEHTCWLCPRTLRQLVRRHGMDVGEIRFGSRYWRDRLVPLPRGIKHTSWHARVEMRPAG